MASAGASAGAAGGASGGMSGGMISQLMGGMMGGGSDKKQSTIQIPGAQRYDDDAKTEVGQTKEPNQPIFLMGIRGGKIPDGF